MNKVLFITYYWPPAGGGGVQRPAKFCKYLREFGWEPVVLTVDGGNFPVIDPSLEPDVAGVEHVYKARTFEPHTVYRLLRGARRAPATASGPRNREEKPSRLGEYVRLNLFVPDSRIGWLASAVRAGMRAIRTHRPAAIFSTAPPYTPHLVAMTLRARSSLPWLADFRDPWVENLAYSSAPRLLPARVLNATLERRVLRNADQVLTVGDNLAQLLAGKLPPDERDKVRVIYNGYDEDDCQPSCAPSERFYVSYFGRVYRKRFSPALCDAMAELTSRRPDMRADLVYRIFGGADPDVERELAARLAPDQVEVHDYISHDEMLRHLFTDQVLTLPIDLVPDDKLLISGKLFEYLGTGNPILGIGPLDGDAAAIVRTTANGRFVSHGDTASIAQFLEHAYDRWKTDGRLAEQQRYPQFSRRNQTGELAELLNHMVARN